MAPSGGTAGSGSFCQEHGSPLSLSASVRRFFCLKHGSSVFHEGGVTGERRVWRGDADALRRWKDSATGIPFVDAHMRELKHTGEQMSQHWKTEGGVVCFRTRAVEAHAMLRWAASLMKDFAVGCRSSLGRSGVAVMDTRTGSHATARRHDGCWSM